MSVVAPVFARWTLPNRAAPVVYSGTRLDLYALQGGCCAHERFGAEAPRYPGADLPASALLDTLLLPLSVLTVLGVGVQASGGL